MVPLKIVYFYLPTKILNYTQELINAAKAIKLTRFIREGTNSGGVLENPESKTKRYAKVRK